MNHSKIIPKRSKCKMNKLDLKNKLNDPAFVKLFTLRRKKSMQAVSVK